MEFGDLRGVLQYVPQFRDKLFVIHLDADVVGSNNFANVVLDLAVLYSLGIRFVVVHSSDEAASDLKGAEIGGELILHKVEGRDAGSSLA
ncbi:MAG TPA: hypothetical protein DCE22_07495 [Verrucomicrobiales bacterium]|nr:hypothetical protein [Verrucomicrobiales bacterium]